MACCWVNEEDSSWYPAIAAVAASPGFGVPILALYSCNLFLNSSTSFLLLCCKLSSLNKDCFVVVDVSELKNSLNLIPITFDTYAESSGLPELKDTLI